MTRHISIFTLLLSMVLAVSACSSTPSNANAVVDTNASPNGEPAGTPSAGAAESVVAPEALVGELYKAHDGKKSPFFQTKDRGLVDKYFTKSTADLIWKDATSSKGEVGALEGDPLYAAQDMEIKNLAIGKGEIKGDDATVAVNFTNFGQKETVIFVLKKVNGAWKIDDIKWPEGTSLVQVIKDAYAAGPDKNSSSGGEFEGKFEVGDTSCVVNSVKMAFEVKWAKGTGTEMFFSKGSTTFESAENKQGGTNSFLFDDESYNSGTFHRADGKTFPVRRAK